MLGQESTRLVISLPRFHFLYYNVEEEKGEVVILKISGRPHLEVEGEVQVAPKEIGIEKPKEVGVEKGKERTIRPGNGASRGASKDSSRV